VANASTSSGKRTAILCLLLAAGTLALYSRAAHAGFLRYDDDRYVVENQHVRSGLHWSTVAWAFTTLEQANWHPLTWLSHALDIQLFGLNPAGHHFMNLLLHAASVVLLFLLLQWLTGYTGRSLAVAALFAVHPINAGVRRLRSQTGRSSIHRRSSWLRVGAYVEADGGYPAICTFVVGLLAIAKMGSNPSCRDKRKLSPRKAVAQLADS
jgi:hypothetical protein